VMDTTRGLGYKFKGGKRKVFYLMLPLISCCPSCLPAILYSTDTLPFGFHVSVFGVNLQKLTKNWI